MVLNSIQPDKSAVSSESILSASNTSKSVLFTWMVLFTTPVLDVVTAWHTRTFSVVLVGCFFFLKPGTASLHSPRWDPASSGRPRRTCTGGRPRADPRWPQSCSDCSSRGEREWFGARSKGIYEFTHLRFKGILVAQLLKEPETKTSLAGPDQRNTVGLACEFGLLPSLSRSCCQARNSWISCGAWEEPWQTMSPCDWWSESFQNKSLAFRCLRITKTTDLSDKFQWSDIK